MNSARAHWIERRQKGTHTHTYTYRDIDTLAAIIALWIENYTQTSSSELYQFQKMMMK